MANFAAKAILAGLVAVFAELASTGASNAADVLPIYRTDIQNLVPAGTTVIKQNPDLDQSVQTSAEEKALLDSPPKLSAFIYVPTGTKPTAGWPAVIIMSGHTGVYTSTATAANKGQASALSNRSKLWTSYLSNKGYIVYLVDDFTSYGDKFIRGFTVSAEKRPAWSSGPNARPYYAYSALSDLVRKYTTVDKSRIFLMGMSNGGTTTLSAFSSVKTPIPASMTVSTAPKFKKALALYPACGMENRYSGNGNGVGLYNTVKPIVMLNAGKDREIDTTVCTDKLMGVIKQNKGTLAFRIMPGAEHTFDGNNQDANRSVANVKARDYALKFALQWFK